MNIYRKKYFMGAPFALLCTAFGLVNCQEYGEKQARKLEERRQIAPTYRVITLEGCEYLRFEATHGYALLTHKGNCRNPIHCYRDTTTSISAGRPAVGSGPR
ncbi:hypothetical protein [Nibrella viscosa]|uniref:hypothetical protein n=1 Tax=Nibrella viscosa TaxID=1084524 RepID=UPI0031E75B59